MTSNVVQEFNTIAMDDYLSLLQFESNNLRALNEFGIIGIGIISLGALSAMYPEVRKYIVQGINILIDLIGKAIRMIKKLFNNFLVNSSDINKTNEEFMKLYGFDLNKISNEQITLDTAIPFSVDYSIEDIRSAAYTSRDLENVLLNRTQEFSSQQSIEKSICTHRAQLLSKPYDSKYINNDLFNEELKNRYFGEQKERTFTISEAIFKIQSFKKELDELNKVKINIEASGNRDIAELTKQINNKNAQLNITDDYAGKIKLLIQYKTTLLSDMIQTFKLLIDRTNASNLQAKKLCIEALKNPNRKNN